MGTWASPYSPASPWRARSGPRLPISLALNVVGLGPRPAHRDPARFSGGRPPGRAVDRVGVATGIFFSSAPNFVMAIALSTCWPSRFAVFPLEGLGNGLGQRGLPPPACPALSWPSASLGFVTKITRASMLEQRSTDYVAFARARAYPGRRIYTSYMLPQRADPDPHGVRVDHRHQPDRHRVRGGRLRHPRARRPLVTVGENTDIPVIQGLVLFVAIWVVLVNLVVDLCYVPSTPG